MIRLLVIADDFTGALDTGVQFSKQGVSTMVEIIDEDIPPSLPPCGDWEVLSVDLETRHLAPAMAARRVAKLVRVARERDIRYIYKKTDSTLRGNIGGELTAMLKEIPVSELVFTPAFPKAKRVTRWGRHYVNEIPLHCTDFARDPFNPVHHSNVKAILKEQSDAQIKNIHYNEYAQLLKPAGLEKTIFIADARSDEDLLKLGNILLQGDRLHYLAGCAGLAELMPGLLNLHRNPSGRPTPSGDILVVSGSVNPMAARQIRYARAHCGYRHMPFYSRQLISPDNPGAGSWMDTVVDRLRDAGKVILEVPQTREHRQATDSYAREQGIAQKDIAAHIADNIGFIVSQVVRLRPVGTLVVFGGDTLRGIIASLPCTGIQPLLEIAPGVVWAKLVGADGTSLHIVTKAGGLGEEHVLGEIDAFLTAPKGGGGHV